MKKPNIMKNLLFTIALMISFSSFGQVISIDDVANASWKEGIVRKYLDQFDDLKTIEGIYNYSSNNPQIQSSYKFLILFDETDFVYRAHLMAASCVGCQHWNLGETKIIFEESVDEGFFNIKWYTPGRRNRKGKKKKQDTYINAEAYEEDEGAQIFIGGGQFGDNRIDTLSKKYPLF